MRVSKVKTEATFAHSWRTLDPNAELRTHSASVSCDQQKLRSLYEVNVKSG